MEWLKNRPVVAIVSVSVATSPSTSGLHGPRHALQNSSMAMCFRCSRLKLSAIADLCPTSSIDYHATLCRCLPCCSLLDFLQHTSKLLLPSLSARYPNVTMLRSGLYHRKFVCRLSVVCNVRVRHTQCIEIFGNISSPFCTLAIL